MGLVPNRRAATFYTAASMEKSHPGSYREDLTAVLDLLARGEIAPVIGKRLALSEAAHAHDLLERSTVTGKIVLICADGD